MDQNIKEMQELLDNEIVKQDYDHEDFEKFAFQIFPEKDELEKWTYQDLKSLIEQYKQMKVVDQQLQQQKQEQQQQQQQSDQKIQDQKIEENITETRPQMRRSKLIPKKPQKQIFNNVITYQIAEKKKYSDEEKLILGQILQERSQIQFDKQIIFSEYVKQEKCQQIKQCIDENVQLTFKVTTKNIKKNLVFSNQVFCIQTLPNNWNVERSKEDVQTLEKIITTYLPEYSGYIQQYDNKQDFSQYLENVLNIYSSKPKIRQLDYFLLFLNENMSKERLLKPFNYYTQNEKDIKDFQFQQLFTNSGQLKIEFSSQNFQSYKNLQHYQNQFYQNYRKFEKKFSESQQIINLEIEKIKQLMQNFKDSNQNIFIQNEFFEKIDGLNLTNFYENISAAIKITNLSKQFISKTIEQISQRLDRSQKYLEQPLIICSKYEQEIKHIYLDQFAYKKKQYLNDKDVQSFLQLYGLGNATFSDYQYETISSILRNVFPLRVDINYEVLQQKKDIFAYLISQVLQEAKKCLSELFYDIDQVHNTNFTILNQTITRIFHENKKN